MVNMSESKRRPKLDELEETMEKAYKYVREKNNSIVVAAEMYRLNYTTLSNYVKKRDRRAADHARQNYLKEKIKQNSDATPVVGQIDLKSNAKRESDWERFKRKIIRSVVRLLIKDKRPEDEVWAAMKKATGKNCQVLWKHLNNVTRMKLQQHIASDDKLTALPESARMTLSDWVMYDLYLAHEDDVSVIYKKDEEYPDGAWLLLKLIYGSNIDELEGVALVKSWRAITTQYNKSGRVASPMLLQRRWFEIKNNTRGNFYNFWHKYRGVASKLNNALKCKPLLFESVVSHCCPDIILKPFVEWKEAVEKRKVPVYEDFIQFKQSGESSTVSSEIQPVQLGSSKRRELDQQDLIIIEKPVQTIDVSNVSDNEESNENATEMPAPGIVKIKQEILEIDEDSDIENIDGSLLDDVPQIDEIDNGHHVEQDDIHEVEQDLGHQVEEENFAQGEKVTIDNELEETDDVVVLQESREEVAQSEIGQSSVAHGLDNIKIVATTHIDEIALESSQKDETICISEEINVVHNTNQKNVASFAGEVDSKVDNLQIVVKEECLVENDTDEGKLVIVKPEELPDAQMSAQNNDVMAVINLEGNLKDISVANDISNINEGVEKTVTSISLIHDNVVESEVLPKDISIVNSEIVDKSDKNVLSDDCVICESDEEEIIVRRTIDEDEFDEDDGEYLDFTDMQEDPVEESIPGPPISEPEEVPEETIKNNIDLKLLMLPVIYTTKLDQMPSLLGKKYESVKTNVIIDQILKDSKPRSRKSVTITNSKQENCDDDDDYLIPISSYLFKKPKNRTYTPVNLCKNPDFNTRLKRLPVLFMFHDKNRCLMKECKPLTVDVCKSFEKYLDGHTIYLKPSGLKNIVKVENSNVIMAPTLISSDKRIINSVSNLKDETEEIKHSFCKYKLMNRPHWANEHRKKTEIEIKPDKLTNLNTSHSLSQAVDKLSTQIINLDDIKTGSSFSSDKKREVVKDNEKIEQSSVIDLDDKEENDANTTANYINLTDKPVRPPKKKQALAPQLTKIPPVKVPAPWMIPTSIESSKIKEVYSDAQLTADTLHKILCTVNARYSNEMKEKAKKYCLSIVPDYQIFLETDVFKKKVIKKRCKTQHNYHICFHRDIDADDDEEPEEVTEDLPLKQDPSKPRQRKRKICKQKKNNVTMIYNESDNLIDLECSETMNDSKDSETMSELDQQFNEKEPKIRCRTNITTFIRPETNLATITLVNKTVNERKDCGQNTQVKTTEIGVGTSDTLLGESEVSEINEERQTRISNDDFMSSDQDGDRLEGQDIVTLSKINDTSNDQHNSDLPTENVSTDEQHNVELLKETVSTAEQDNVDVSNENISYADQFNVYLSKNSVFSDTQHHIGLSSENITSADQHNDNTISLKESSKDDVQKKEITRRITIKRKVVSPTPKPTTSEPIILSDDDDSCEEVSAKKYSKVERKTIKRKYVFSVKSNVNENKQFPSPSWLNFVKQNLGQNCILLTNIKIPIEMYGNEPTLPVKFCLPSPIEANKTEIFPQFVIPPGLRFFVDDKIKLSCVIDPKVFDNNCLHSLPDIIKVIEATLDQTRELNTPNIVTTDAFMGTTDTRTLEIASDGNIITDPLPGNTVLPIPKDDSEKNADAEDNTVNESVTESVIEKTASPANNDMDAQTSDNTNATAKIDNTISDNNITTNIVSLVEKENTECSGVSLCETDEPVTNNEPTITVENNSDNLNQIKAVDLTDESDDITTNSVLKENKSTSNAISPVKNSVNMNSLTDKINDPVVLSDDSNEVNDQQTKESNNSEPTKEKDATQKKSILSDLMEMSGISAEDTANTAVPEPPIIPESNAVPLIQIPMTLSNDKYLHVIHSIEMMKYASHMNGVFYKLNLTSNTLKKVSIGIRKKFIVGGSKDGIVNYNVPYHISVSNSDTNRTNRNIMRIAPKPIFQNDTRNDRNKRDLQHLLLSAQNKRPVNTFKPIILKRRYNQNENYDRIMKQIRKDKEKRKQTPTTTIDLSDSDDDIFQEEHLEDHIFSDEEVQTNNPRERTSSVSSDDEPLSILVKRRKEAEKANESLRDESTEVVQEYIETPLSQEDSSLKIQEPEEMEIDNNDKEEEDFILGM